MEVYREQAPQKVYVRNKKNRTAKLKDITNKSEITKKKQTKRKANKKNISSNSKITKRQQKKTKEEPISEHLLQIKEQFASLANDTLPVITRRKKQDKITTKAISISIFQLSKESSVKLNEELEINENLVDTNIGNALADPSNIIDSNIIENDTDFDSLPIDLGNLNLDDEQDDLDTLEVNIHEEPLSESELSLELELDFSMELSDNDNIVDNKIDTQNIVFDTFCDMNDSIDQDDICDNTTANTIMRIANLISCTHNNSGDESESSIQLDDLDETLDVLDSDNTTAIIPESHRMAELILNNFELENITEEIEIDGEQTRTLNAVLGAMTTKNSFNSSFQMNEFSELEDLNDTENITLHGDFTTTLDSVMKMMKM